jgi:hypothetical protein
VTENRNGRIVDTFGIHPLVTLGAEALTTVRILSMTCGSMNAAPDVAQNTNGRSSAIRGTPVTPVVNGSASRPRKLWLDENDRRAADGQIPGAIASDGLSPSRLRLTIWRGCSCWKLPHEHPCPMQARRTVADRRSRYPRSYLSKQRTDRLRRPASTSNKGGPRLGSLSGLRRNGQSHRRWLPELLDDGTIEGEFAHHNGDEALLKASGRAIC